MPRYIHISIAIPMLDELPNVPCLVEMLRSQTFKSFTLYVCVNQPDAWWNGTPFEQRMCVANADTIAMLRSVADLDIRIIDRCTPSHGWTPKQQGVGWARKEQFSLIQETASPDELVVSLDADTAFSPEYLQQVLDSMNLHPEASALAVPYYHPLSGWESSDRALLRYECYMRHYLIHLLEISNPYAFSALGSAMVFPLWAYKRVGGITPLQGGEDFYLMQKFAKTGSILLHTDGLVMPQGRMSHRVPFGTGPAVAAALDVQREKYPFYSPDGFRAVSGTFALLPRLYREDIDTPMSAFMRQQLKTDDLWSPLRKNFKTEDRFVNAAIERLDGLRILQFLKQFPVSESYLSEMLSSHGIAFPSGLDFATTPIAELDAVRHSLYLLEQQLREQLTATRMPV